MKKPVVLCIMDGFGIRDITEGNAIHTAKTPNLDKFFSENPFTTIGASGLDVGLPDGQMGNSEVGHTNIGAGRVVYQMLVKITKDINDGVFFDIDVLKNAKRTTPPSILLVFCLMVAYTATSTISMVFWKWLRKMALIMFMFIALWMDAMFLPQAVLDS